MEAVIEVLLTTCAPVAAVPPKVTLAPLRKFVPVIVTAVPPEVVAEFGETAVTFGAGFAYVQPLVSVPLWLSVLVTTTLAVPAECAGVVAVMEVPLTTVTRWPTFLLQLNCCSR